MEDIIIESSLSRTLTFLKNYDCCTISAFRPRTKAQNKLASSKLGAELKTNKGYTYFLVDGSWVNNFGQENAKESKELTYFVVNGNFDKTFFEDMKKLGEKFDQDSIMCYPLGKNPYLLGTSKRENAYPKYNQKVQLGKIIFGKEARSMTKVNNRPFSAPIKESINYFPY